MTHTVFLKYARVPGVLLVLVALTTSGGLRAQARPDAPEPPDIRMLVLAQDRPSDEEQRAANPCPRDRFMARVDWDRGAWLAFCVQRARSRFASLAWKQGLDPHGEALPANASARKLAEMEIWLRRLPGKYRVEGKYWNSGGSSPATGSADCFGIGSGPGVSCAISTDWKAPKESRKDPYLDAALHNAMRGLVLLFGIDPGASEVRATLVDFRAIRTSGFLDEGVVMFQGRPDIERLFFTSSLVTYTWATSLVAVKPDGDLTMKLLVHAADLFSTPEPILFDLQLHRDPLFDAEGSVSRVAGDEGYDIALAGEESEGADEPEISSVDLADVDERDNADGGMPGREKGAAEVPRARQQAKTQPAIDTLDDVSVLGELERQRRVQPRSPPRSPDVVTVTRKGATEVRLQPSASRDTIHFRRESAARQAPDGMRPTMQLHRDYLTSGEGPKIRDVTLDLAANVEEPDGLPALIPFGKRTSLINIDHVRLDDPGRSTLTRVTNVINPQTRRCQSVLALGDSGERFQNRFVLQGDRMRDCDAAVRERQGDLFFADDLPQRLRQDLGEIYDPIYNRFARLLGSEPGMVFVAWRPDSARSDLRFERNWSRSVLLLFNGSAWQQGIAPEQRKYLENAFATEQIVRRLGWDDERHEFTLSAMDYLLMLDSLHDEHATVRRLTTELPDWIAGCARDLKIQSWLIKFGDDVVSYNCGLVLQFVYDAVARAKSGGSDTVYATWRGLLTASFERGRSGAESSAFIASSDESRRITQGLLSTSMDWRKFVEELDKFGVRLNLTLAQSAPVVEVVSLAHFRD